MNNLFTTSTSQFLLIDDDDATNVFHTFVIEKAIQNATVNVTTSGQDGLEWIKANQSLTLDVIFLDINMPLMTGWEFLEKLAHFPQSSLPKRIVIFQNKKPTSSQTETLRKITSEISFHEKPVTLEWLKEFINHKKQ